MKKELPKWSERTLAEKILTCLVIIFGVIAIIFIILELLNINMPKRLDSLFIDLELLSIGLLNYKYNKKLSLVLLVLCAVSLVITLLDMFLWVK